MIRSIVTDIEGTTTSLSFVKDELFPYARAHMADFVTKHAGQQAVAALLHDVRLNLAQELQVVPDSLTQENLIHSLERWIEEDRKMTPLKALQGMIWEAGYQRGDFFGHVYPDAEQALRDWHHQGINLYLYSSGSIYAQKLLFSHTRYGDLTPWFSGYFDTTIGVKQDAQSYRKIVQSLQQEESTILFLSDIEAELDAARQAGMQTCWLVREDLLDNHARHLQVSDFSRIPLD